MRSKKTFSGYLNNYFLHLLVTTLLFSLTHCYAQPSLIKNTTALAQQTATPKKNEAARLFQRANQLFRRSQYPSALETYQQVLQLRREIGDKIGEGKTLLQIGITYRLLAEYTQAREYVELASKIAKSTENISLQAASLMEMGIINYRLSQYSQALELYQQALAVSRKISAQIIEYKTLDHIGVVYRQQGEFNRALEFHQQALAISREIDDKSNRARILNNIGVVYTRIGEYPKAVEWNNQALAVSREVGDRFIESRIVNSIGVVYNNQGDYGKALQYYQQGLAIRQEIGDKAGEGYTLNNIGTIKAAQGDYGKAREYYQQALAIRQEIGDRLGEATTVSNIGHIYWNQGQYPQALEYYQQALTISRDIGDRPGVGYILASIGGVYYSQGEYSQALDFYQQALEIRKVIGDKSGESYSLNSIGGTYFSLGEYKTALEYYQRSLSIRQKIGDKAGEGTSFSNIGLVYDVLGQAPEALKYYRQALSIRQEIGDKPGEANTLTNIGIVYDTQKQYRQALANYQQSLSIRQEIGDRFGEATTLNNLGLVYDNLGNNSEALDSYQQALAIFREIGNPDGERVSLGNMGYVFEKQQQTELAIIFYKASVNVTEKIRQNLQPLSQTLQQSYADRVADTYRRLADLLLQQDRVLEAQQVLDLLKVQELDDYLNNVRGNEQTAAGIENLPIEKQILAEYEKLQKRAIAIGRELGVLRRLPSSQKTPTQEQKIQQLISQQEKIRQQLRKFISRPDVIKLVQKLKNVTDESFNLKQFRNVSENLQKLGRNVGLLYPLILEDRLELILIKPNSPPIRRTVSVTKAELNAGVLAFRVALTDPRKRQNIEFVKESANQLYDWLIQPWENDLTLADVETIIYAPDGQLRYIPLTALYDGNKWLVEKFQVNYITAASLTNLDIQPQTQLRILAAAFSSGNYSFTVGDRHFEFSGLPFAGVEVENLVEEIPQTTKLLNNEFSKAMTIPLMDKYSVVHFATHAAFISGNPEDSFIMFGDGDLVTLREVRDSWFLTNVDLLVLSACQTAVGGKLGNGEEILGFGYLMQEVGAKATVASLWRVDDGGTQILMNNFYQWLQTEKVTKAQALRQAQISLITGQYNPQQLAALVRQKSPKNDLSSQIVEELRHPYYWASFILIGNGF
ncbi:CHAT domain-containing protein [Dapis sp. BLCC M126]|uniref:CHAT domain-containing protein n=1 Tax=Dapis sp. BLCC M126 TaxID=3400189 RepID=UPI003CF0E025